ncbi:HAD family phosphatase [Flavobacterium sp.]|uniref:HAD family hydrolase n=1 Tax=Flavobacterium sp. TaxID=239 RepID=UPI002ED8CAD2
MVKAIIFDFGGVLIDWNPSYLYRKVLSEEEMNWFLTNICNEEWNREQDRGRKFSDGIAELKEKHANYASYIEMYYNRWDEMLNGEVSGTAKILGELKKSYKIYGLTNWSAETFPIAFSKFAFFQLFDGIVVSGQEKLIKPEEDIFRLLLSRFDLKAEECIFIDDSRENAAAAGRLGFVSIHFKDSQQLKEDLLQFGIMSSD